MLTTVTITGADDAVDPGHLARLSEEFPFVEWGILFSPKREGDPRYPTREWVSKLPAGIRLSAHLCGQCARDTMGNADYWIRNKEEFSRIQINGWAPPVTGLARLAKDYSGYEFILQVRDENALHEAAECARIVGNASALFDPSGGRGIKSFRWPAPPFNLRLGYAGGIKPSNVLDVLALGIGVIDSPFWIDMESGVRDGDNRMDLDLVRDVLEKCAPMVAA